MKTPEEIKKGLWWCPGQYSGSCGRCPYSNDGRDCGRNGVQIMKDALAYIQQLEAEKAKPGEKLICQITIPTADALLKAIEEVELDGKTLAEWLELVKGYKQLEADLAAAKRERDAAVSELPHNCWNCKYHLDKPIEETDDFGRTIHRYCEADCCYPDEENSSWEWRGVCPENTEVQEDAAE